MKKKTLVAAIISILMAGIVILSVGLMSAIHKPDDQKLSFVLPVEVKDGEIEAGNEPIHFEPIGNKASFYIDMAGPVGLRTDVKVYSGNPVTATPVTGTIDAGGSLELVITDAKNQDIYLVMKPVTDGTVAPATYNLGYQIRVESSSKVVSPMPLITMAAVLVLAVYLILVLNKEKKNYDERQLAARSEATMNAFVVAIACCIGMALLSKSVTDFPLSVYGATIITAIVAVTTFGIQADLNDAYVALNENRKKSVILAWVLTGLAFLAFGMIFLGLGYLDDYAATALVVMACNFCFAIEVTIKTIIEKAEVEDEES